jgi:hypothetical protein
MSELYCSCKELTGANLFEGCPVHGTGAFATQPTVAELRARIAELEDERRALVHGGADLRIKQLESALNDWDTKGAELMGRITKLEADKRRLDWLEKVGFSTWHQGGVERDYRVHAWRYHVAEKWSWTAQYISSEYDNARAAIDAAMEAEAQP